jgi:DNA adenine methylase
MNNKSPLRYPGGKTRACKILEPILNNNLNINSDTVLISPFFGGGSFEFYLQNKYQLRVIANDKFKPLFNFWNESQKNNEKICKKLENHIESTHITKEDFNNFRNNILNLKDPFEQAVYYFIINRCSFSGATLSGGFSLEASKKRFTKSSILRVKNLDLTKIIFKNEDFKDFLIKLKFKVFLDKYNIKKYLIFLDPPYYLKEKSTLYGNNGDMHENFQHNELAKTLKKFNNWIMTYNDCKYIRNLYKNYTIFEVDWKYGMNKNKKSSEIVIINK